MKDALDSSLTEIAIHKGLIWSPNELRLSRAYSLLTIKTLDDRDMTIRATMWM